ncbi:MAG: TldD/PmbA family protein [Defluviitoga tunisiensis]|jgi:PmbA protein|uniref:Putative modulator of DNA gyrase (TldD and pmbA) n=2 Tax=Defluviitoga tunisiensis TaxID=1006576 RepID=A0A0C7P0V3_DEFTU|nr:putative modulator of DNA gyrase (tldD and pmbA) [Defluviitoga tunisiensis]
MMNNIQQILEKALLLIKNNDCKGQINVFSVENKNASFSSGKLEQLSEGEQGSVGIKIISKEGKIATSTTNILSEKGINQAVEKAIQMVKYTQPDEAHDVSDEEEFTYIDWAFDVDTKNMSLNEVMELAQNLEQKAKKSDPRIKFVRGASYETSLTRIYFANTNGLYKNALFTNAGASISLAAIDDQNSAMGFDFEVAQSARLIEIDRIVRNSVDLAISGLSAEVLRSGRYDIILSPVAAGMLISTLTTPLSGENVYKGKSFLKDRLGEKVANNVVNLIHDPMNGSAPLIASFDNEGTNTSRFNIIENGVLKSYLHSIYSANKFNTKPTGNSFAYIESPNPSIGTINMHLISNKTRKEIINVPKALYVTNIMGLHTADPISGRFSVQISGRVIENGEFVGSFRGMTLAGTLQELLNNLESVGSDFKYFGNVAGSTTLIRNLSVGGK